MEYLLTRWNQTCPQCMDTSGYMCRDNDDTTLLYLAKRLVDTIGEVWGIWKISEGVSPELTCVVYNTEDDAPLVDCDACIIGKNRISRKLECCSNECWQMFLSWLMDQPTTVRRISVCTTSSPTEVSNVGT